MFVDKDGAKGGVGGIPTNADVLLAFWTAMGKVDQLKNQVKSLDDKIDNLIGSASNRIESAVESSTAETEKSKVKPSKDKKGRVEEEKLRQFNLVKDRLNIEEESKSECEESSEDEPVDLKALKKKMSRKQRDLCGRKAAARLHQAGALFPQDSFESTSSSGTVSDVGKSRRKKSQIKSGAKIKKRPVVQTELWPHTIANEDDGEEVDSESISLAKFFSCFSFIMLHCSSKAEAKGRTALLHAVSIVLEYLQWSEARTFHNVIMVKIEQKRVDWASDFSILAESYIDKKVRQSVKTRRYPAGASSSYRSGYSGKSIGKGFGASSKGYSTTAKNKSLHGVICWQWNQGTCSYGENCKRWHVCRVCAEAGKLGEPHKASTHDSSGSRSRTGDRA